MSHLPSIQAIKEMPGRALIALIVDYAGAAAGGIRGSQDAMIAAGLSTEWDSRRAAEHHSIIALAALAEAFNTYALAQEAERNRKWEPPPLFIAAIKAARQALVTETALTIGEPKRAGIDEEAPDVRAA